MFFLIVTGHFISSCQKDHLLYFPCFLLMLIQLDAVHQRAVLGATRWACIVSATVVLYSHSFLIVYKEPT